MQIEYKTFGTVERDIDEKCKCKCQNGYKIDRKLILKIKFLAQTNNKYKIFQTDVEEKNDRQSVLCVSIKCMCAVCVRACATL